MVADKNGNTIVYNDKDVPIGTGSVRKVGDRSYEVSNDHRERNMAINMENMGIWPKNEKKCAKKDRMIGGPKITKLAKLRNSGSDQQESVRDAAEGRQTGSVLSRADRPGLHGIHQGGKLQNFRKF